MELIEFPHSAVQDIPTGLRNLADKIEAGDVAPHNIVWVMDEGDGEIGVGLLGRAAAPGAEAHLLLAVAMRRLEQV